MRITGCRPVATLFVVDRKASTKALFGSQIQHRRPDLGRVLEGKESSLVYKIKAPKLEDLNYFDQ